ncbi:glycosyltransferase family 4 protein [Leptolyngbyaceae cyanobacterium CCMR0082]|uniref:Glycosyltransferase family 4 protein n=2 Tax=Adonisia turfae TaxID=2950184 RepID=A0A6M0SDC0_9CYAN|nr:glycosyltransferase [Adonisia turfae]MDV3350198.1 glycosyltransferase [Leptothoe sp. LEGE 181152]NEZ57847.1 glycosyltransferase family 4 protein [Adonisia turfae CCMR0081]NEZ66475.1 glycosyltransferase family 4 protein [Adonisia turfae CCMR0082]
MSLNKKHILVLSSVYPLFPDGNHGAFIRETILRLQPTGATFSVFAPAYEGGQSYELEGVKVYRFRYFWKRFETLVRDGAPTKLKRQPFNLIPAVCYVILGTWQLVWLCRKIRPNLLHVHWPFPHGLMAWPASKLFKIPMVFSFHGGELLLAQRFGFVAHILRWLLSHTVGVTTNSSFTKGLVEKLRPCPLQVIPYGLTVEAKPTEPRAPEQIPTLLFVGRLDERKGVCYLLDALAILLTERDVRLRIVGTGILETELKEQVQGLALEQQVDFLGFVSKAQLADEYAKCDVFVLPAIVDSKGDTEGLGIVMIEALAHAKPVVATAVGGIPDVIRPGETGCLVPEKNSLALAKAIAELLDRPDWATQLGHQGLADIQTRFNWSSIIAMWQDIYQRVL